LKENHDFIYGVTLDERWVYDVADFVIVRGGNGSDGIDVVVSVQHNGNCRVVKTGSRDDGRNARHRTVPHAIGCR
jgi:hypothetical protein